MPYDSLNIAWRTFRTVWLTLGSVAMVILYAQFIGVCHFNHNLLAEQAVYKPMSKTEQAQQIVQLFGGKRR